MSLQFKFTSILSTQKEEIDRNAIKVTVENMEMAQAELLAFLQDSIASAVRCTTDLNRHSMYLYVAEKHAKQPEEMLYLIKDTQEQITLTPAFTQEEPFFVEWGFQKPFTFKRKHKPVVVSEVEDAIAEAAVATNEETVSEESESKTKSRLIKQIRAVGKQLDLDTDTGIKNYCAFVWDTKIELSDRNIIAMSNSVETLEFINLKLHEEFNKCMDVIKDIMVLDPEAEVKPGLGYTKLTIIRTHLREEKEASEQQMELFEEEETMTNVENKEVEEVVEEIGLELDVKDTQIISLTAELQEKDEKLSAMQKQLEEVMKQVKALSTATPAAPEVTAAKEAPATPVMNEGRKVVLDAFARLVAKKMRELGHQGKVEKADIIKWVEANQGIAKTIMKDAEKEAMLEDIVRMPGFKSLIKYLNDNFKAMNRYLVDAAFGQIDKGTNQDVKDVVKELKTRFNNDSDKISEFLKGQMTRFFNVDFMGMYKSGVAYTADAVSFLGNLHKTVFYIIGDAGETVANAVAGVLYKHAGVDKEGRTNTVKAVVEKVTPEKKDLTI